MQAPLRLIALGSASDLTHAAGIEMFPEDVTDRLWSGA